MGFSRKRVGSDGRAHYAAVYRDARGQIRHAGTFENRKQAERAWQHIETLMASGRPGDPTSGRVSFADYVNQRWYPHHVLEPTTRESYRYSLDRHIIPWFGSMKMADILPIHVREWVTELTSAGVSPANIRHLKIILSAVFTTALNDFVIVLHPCRGVKTPTVAVREYRILTPAEVTTLLAALPSDTARLLVEVAIGSGLRWGELTELRPTDLHAASGILTITRVVAEINPAFHPEGDRFLIKPYPKNKRSRRFRLDPTLVEQISEHVRRHNLSPDDLLFRFDTFIDSIAPSNRLQSVENLGLTEPTAAGRRYAQARCRPTPPAAAAARIAEPRSPRIAQPAARPATTPPASHACATPTATCPAIGSATKYGDRRVIVPAWTHGRAYTTCDTPMRRGYSPAAPTCRS